MKCRVCKTEWKILYAHVAKVKDGRKVCQCPKCGRVAPLEECVEKEEILRLVPTASNATGRTLA